MYMYTERGAHPTMHELCIRISDSAHQFAILKVSSGEIATNILELPGKLEKVAFPC